MECNENISNKRCLLHFDGSKRNPIEILNAKQFAKDEINSNKADSRMGFNRQVQKLTNMPKRDFYLQG
jgi:hypothetical protein